MSRQNRVELLTKRLTDRVDNVEGDSTYKLAWLLRHFEQYIERWLAFAKNEEIKFDATLRNEVFYVVLAAANVLQEKIAALSPKAFPQEEWSHFRNALQWIQRSPERGELQVVTDTFAALQKKLPYGDIDVDMSA